MRRHNVDVDALKETVHITKDNPGMARFVLDLKGTWYTDPNNPQFEADLEYPRGAMALVADSLPLFGGEGRAPAPMLYFFFGAMACYASTFANVAALEDATIKSMSVEALGTLDYAPVLGLTDDPFLDELIFKVIVDTDAPDEKLQRIRHFTDEQCPAVQILQKSIDLHVHIARKERPEFRVS
ncbi:MAG: OsmC family protein [Candidatus Aquicultor sp.]